MQRRRLIAAAAVLGAAHVRGAVGAGPEAPGVEPGHRHGPGDAGPPVSRSPQPLQPPPQSSQQAASVAEHAAWLKRGEAKLAAGDSEAALADFDRAAQLLHAADSEVSLVRAWMQQGEYRRALAFVAHTAQAHASAAGAVLYAWLLSRGGQHDAARRVLASAGESRAADPLLRQARELLERPGALPGPGLLAPPLRLAPYTVGALPPRHARVVATGALLADGRHALSAAAALRGARRIWLRNGLGQTVQAEAVARAGDDGLPAASAVVALRAAQPLPAPAEPTPAEPFPGSPGSVLVHQADAFGRPVWPGLHAGFLGMPDPALAGLRRLGIDLPARPGERPPALPGGPVFDAAGRWIGLALPHPDGVPRIAMRSLLARGFGAWVEPPSALRAAAGTRAGLEEVYERALRSTLQVIVAA